ncbi:MAG TPA: hypothetical protein VGN97_21190 [Mesorhizobium sp.]|nr:hypothetical protein [Mesorhizobium sp.]
MFGEKDVVSFTSARRESRQKGDGNAPALQQAAKRLAEMGRGGSGLRTKELVGLLLSHGARTWRNSFPRTDVRLRVFAPNGKPAIKIRLD